MQSDITPVVKDLVLVGGGHAHVAVLRRFGMRPMPGLRLTLISRDIHTPYSGMLPGFIAGHYDYDDCHIDLGPLARFAGARLYHAEVDGLDLKQQHILVPDRPPVSFDLLSINTGSRPATQDVPGALQYAMPVKPIDKWLEGWEKLQSRVLSSKGVFHIVVVGGGAGGVELALSTQYKLAKLLTEQNDDPQRLHYELLTDGEGIFTTHNPGVRHRFERILAERGIALYTRYPVIEVTADAVIVEGHQPRPADAVLWVTQASAPQWLGKAGLAVDAAGFVAVNDYLQSVSHPMVFAAGDVAALKQIRAKSGVFAVRQGPVLTENLRRAATGRRLTAYKPQDKFLGLISTGDRYAVASRGGWSLEGRWLWQLKDWIDRRFMQHFHKLPEMTSEHDLQLISGVADENTLKELPARVMRCGGCGAKIGSTVLSRVIQRLPPQQHDDVLIGLDSPDDAAVLRLPEGKLMVQSVDYFRAFIDDAFLFGQIAANHALGDLFAMGAEPQSVLAIATIPYGRGKVLEETLYELLSGALKALGSTGAVLVGGHSSEGAELAFGLTVNGLVDKDQMLLKGGLIPGNVLILTKPIGTGTLFAADMRYKAKGRWIDSALTSMLVSSQLAADSLLRHGATACTDVTGFGLLGHLAEMTKAAGVDVEINIEAIPLLDGATETIAAGILSSLQPQNLRLRRAVRDLDRVSKHPLYPLLFDPQTAGGLLAAVPEEKAQTCIDELRQRGYTTAAIIGSVKESSEADEPPILVV